MKISSDISSIKLFFFRFSTLPLLFVSLGVKSDPPTPTSHHRVSNRDWNETTGELPAMTVFPITQISSAPSSMTSHSSTDSINGSVIERTTVKLKSHQLDNRRHRRHHRGNEIRHAYYTTRKADRSGYNDEDDDDDDDNNLFGGGDYDDDDDDISNSIQPLSTMNDGKTDSNPHKHPPSAAHRRDSQVRNFNITVVSSGSEEKQEEDEGDQPTDWCSLDTGFNVIKDRSGHRHRTYISVTKDGSVWLRLGKEYSSFDWSSASQKKVKVQTPVIDDEILLALKTLEFSDICILTDLELSLQMQSGWNPSYMTVYDPLIHETKILSFKNIKNCKVSTKIELTADKQNLLCTSDTGIERFAHWNAKVEDISTNSHSNEFSELERGLEKSSQKISSSRQDTYAHPSGRNFSNQYLTNPGGQLHSCGLRNLPLINQLSPTWFIKYVNFDLLGSDHWYCPSSGADNKFTFSGSFYHAYLKMAVCRQPRDSRILGHDVKLRSKEDREENRIIIFDPSMRALADGWVQSWHYYAQVVSIHHYVSIQIWRPCGSMTEENLDKFCFAFVGQSSVYPTELHFHDVLLPDNQKIHVKRGDVIGLYHRRSNPVGWSCVPCSPSTPNQQHLVFPEPSEHLLTPGKVFYFTRSAPYASNPRSRPYFSDRGKGSDNESKHPERPINLNEVSACPCRQYSVAALFANKSQAKIIDSWECPSGKKEGKHNPDQNFHSNTLNSYRVPFSISLSPSSPTSSPSTPYPPSFVLSLNNTREEQNKFHRNSSHYVTPRPTVHHHPHHRHPNFSTVRQQSGPDLSTHDGFSTGPRSRTKISNTGKHLAHYLYFSTSSGDADVMCLVIVLLTVLMLGFLMLLIGSLSFYKACHLKTS